MTTPQTGNEKLSLIAHKIGQLNLDAIKIKLMDAEDGEAWTREEADTADLDYRRFLFLTAKYPEMEIVPSGKADIFWHYHILDTMKYYDDCQNIFGYFLHHFPYLGMRSASDAVRLENAFAGTKELFLIEFGDAEQSYAETSEAPKCKRQLPMQEKYPGDNERPFFMFDPSGPVNIFENRQKFAEA